MEKNKQNKPKDTVKLRGENGFNYRPKWAVIIICDDEKNQKQTYESLKVQGYQCRVVNV